MELGAVLSDPILAIVAAGLLFCVFLRGAVHKLSDFTWFTYTLAEYRIVPRAAAPAAAGILAASESAVALGLLLPQSRIAAALAAGLLLLLYGAAIAFNLLRGRARIECGCGGTGEGLSWVLVFRNAGLAGIAFIAARAPFVAGLDAMAWMTAAASVASLWLLLVGIEKLSANRSYLAAADLARGQYQARH